MFLNFDPMPPPLRGRLGIRRLCGRRERCRQSAARFLAARLRSAFGGPPCGGARSLQGMRSFWVCGPFGHAISQVHNLFKSASGGGPPARSGRRDGAANRRHGVWCRPTGRRKTAWQRPGSKPAAALLPAGPIGPAEWCRPIGRHGVWCRAIARHGVWCRLLAARRMVPPIGGTGYGAAQWGGTVPGGAVLGRREQFADWLTVLAGRQTGTDRNWGFSGRECGVLECGAWECGCLGACGVRNAESGDCPPARLGRRERCRAIARHGVWCRLLAALAAA